MKRHVNALGIMEGARNLRAIAKSLVEAADEAAGEGISAERDAAVRMIVYRLGKLCCVEEIAYGYDALNLNDTYCTLMRECRTRAEEGTKVPVKIEEPIILLHHAVLAELPDGMRG
jgi:hypothetical protein